MVETIASAQFNAGGQVRLVVNVQTLSLEFSFDCPPSAAFASSPQIAISQSEDHFDINITCQLAKILTRLSYLASD